MTIDGNKIIIKNLNSSLIVYSKKALGKLKLSVSGTQSVLDEILTADNLLYLDLKEYLTPGTYYVKILLNSDLEKLNYKVDPSNILIVIQSKLS